MKHAMRQLAILLSLILIPLSCIRSQVPQYTLEELVDSLISVAQLPSFSLAILKDGEVAYTLARGFADLEKESPATPRTQYRMASVSKILTVSALAKLVDEGRMTLDAKVSEFLPDFPDIGEATVSQLAGHLGGIAHYQMTDKIELGKHYLQMEECLDVFKSSPRAGGAGEQYVYSTHGFTLLSAVMEKAADQPFLEYLEDRVLHPLGMDHTGPDDRLQVSDLMSALYGSGKTKIAQPEDPSYKWAGGGMISNPSDMVKLAKGYFEGFFQPQTIETMWTTQSTAAGVETGVGIGWRIGKDFLDRRMVYHAGAMGGARSVILLYPELELAIATNTNSVWVSVVELNASVILEAFLSKPGTASVGPGTYEYSGSTWDGETTGQLTIQHHRGSISTPEPLKSWFGEKSIDRMPLFFIRDDLWALVTPYGIVPLTLSLLDDQINGRMFIRDDRVWEFSGIRVE